MRRRYSGFARDPPGSPRSQLIPSPRNSSFNAWSFGGQMVVAGFSLREPAANGLNRSELRWLGSLRQTRVRCLSRPAALFRI